MSKLVGSGLLVSKVEIVDSTVEAVVTLVAKGRDNARGVETCEAGLSSASTDRSISS